MYLTSISNLGNVVGRRIDLIFYREEMEIVKEKREEEGEENLYLPNHTRVYIHIGIYILDRNNILLIIINSSIR